jgi:hypothetical protein
MKQTRKIRRTKGRRTKGRRTRRMKMTGGTKKPEPVTHTNIAQKIGYAKRARLNKNVNADKLEEYIDDYITKNNAWKYKDWKYGDLKPTYTKPNGTYNHDWFFVERNKNTAIKNNTDAESERTGW